MTKLENNIKNLCVENMGIYGCKHAVKEHVWTGKAHMIAKLKKNVKSMQEEPFVYACMFFSAETLISCVKEILWEDREDVEKYIQNKRIAQELELDYTFSAPIAEGIAMGTDWNQMHPASSERLVICKDNYTSFRIVTAYPYPSFDEMDEWYDAVDQGFKISR